jgi:amino acid permease
MNHLILGAFYDTVNTSVGPTLASIFLLLMFIELIYVMAKYLNSSDSK